MFPVFPVLFPVCSHFAASAFIEFPVFSVVPACSISAIFYRSLWPAPFFETVLKLDTSRSL